MTAKVTPQEIKNSLRYNTLIVRMLLKTSGNPYISRGILQEHLSDFSILVTGCSIHMACDVEIVGFFHLVFVRLCMFGTTVVHLQSS